MATFTPVALVSKDGRDYTARSAVELNNLEAQGYTRKNGKRTEAPVSAPVSTAPVANLTGEEKAVPADSGEKAITKGVSRPGK